MISIESEMIGSFNSAGCDARTPTIRCSQMPRAYLSSEDMMAV